MKSLKTLIKLHKKELDDSVKQIRDCEEKRNIHITNLKKLQNEILDELKKYTGTEYVFMLDNYMKSAEEQERNLKKEIETIENQIAILTEKLTIQFAELKKFEIALQNRLLIEKEAEKKDNIKMIDEFNSMKFVKDK